MHSNVGIELRLFVRALFLNRIFVLHRQEVVFLKIIMRLDKQQCHLAFSIYKKPNQNSKDNNTLSTLFIVSC